MLNSWCPEFYTDRSAGHDQLNGNGKRLLKVAEHTLAQCQRLDGSDPEEMRELRRVVNQIKQGE